MTMTALKAWVNLEVLTHTDLNLYIGTGGNLSHMFAEMATAAGQMIYATGNKAVAVLAAGTATQVLHGGTTPSWSQVAAADLAGSIPYSKLETAQVCVTKMTGTQSITNGISTPINWDAEDSDPASMHSTTVNNDRITPGRVGYFLVGCALVFPAFTAASIRLTINHSGGLLPATTRDVSDASRSRISHVVGLGRITGVAEYFTVDALQESGSSQNVGGSTLREANFWCMQVPGA